MEPTASARPNRRTAAAFLWFGTLLAAVFLLGCTNVTSGDIWWHLRTGQLILERGHVPHRDWFTYTNPDAVWIDLHWGFQILAAWLWSWGGPEALVITKAALGTLSIGLCLCLAPPRWPAWLVTACWLLPVLLFAQRYAVRPEMLTYLFLAATLAILSRARDRARLLWLLPALQLAWVNVHALFVLQYVVMGCAIVEAFIGSYAPRRSAGEREEAGLWLKRLAITFALCLAASLANPYGLQGALFPVTLFEKVRGQDREFYHQFSFELVGMDTLVRSLGWRGLFANLQTWLTTVLAFLLAASFLARARHRAVSIYRLLLCLAFGYLTWRMIRNSALLAIVGGTVLTLNVGDWFDAARSRTLPSKASRGISSGLKLSTALVQAAFVTAIPTGLYHQLLPSEPPRHFSFGATSEGGHAAARFAGRKEMPEHIFAIYERLAAVCIFEAGPEKKVFADGRLELNSRETLERYLLIERLLVAGDPRAEAELRRAAGPPAESSPAPLPSLVFDNTFLLSASMNRPGLIDHLLGSGRWRCVFSESDDQAARADPRRLVTGATVFIADEYAQRHEIPPAEIATLLRYLEALRQSAGERNR